MEIRGPVKLETGFHVPAGSAMVGLTITQANPGRPLRAGGESSYRIEVTNQTRSVQQDVAVTVILPKNLLPVPLGTTPSHSPIDGQEIHFLPVENVYPKERLVFHVRVRAREPGPVKVQAQRSHRGSPQPILVETTTTILPESEAGSGDEPGKQGKSGGESSSDSAATRLRYSSWCFGRHE